MVEKNKDLAENIGILLLMAMYFILGLVVGYMWATIY